MITTLIFDFDGLILDTEGPEFQVWQEIYQSFGTELDLATWATGIGTSADAFNPYAHLETLIGRPVDRHLMAKEKRARMLALIEQQPPLPGVESLLTEAKKQGIKIGLASSSDHTWVDGHLARLGLIDQFDCIKCAGDVAVVKPDPALYLAALACLEAESERAVAFEDSPNGVLAARRAGLFCIAVPNRVTAPLPLDHANLRLSSLAEFGPDELLQRLDALMEAENRQLPSY